jgi:hypothetical protein
MWHICHVTLLVTWHRCHITNGILGCGPIAGLHPLPSFPLFFPSSSHAHTSSLFPFPLAFVPSQAAHFFSFFSLRPLAFVLPVSSFSSQPATFFSSGAHSFLQRHYSVFSPPILTYFWQALRQLHSPAPLSISDDDQVYIYIHFHEKPSSTENIIF